MTRNATILLIEEHPIIAEMMQIFISTHKPLCKLIRVATDEEALVHLKAQPIHLVITHLHDNLPNDSFAFLAMLNGWNPPVPIIAICERGTDDPPSLAGGIAILRQPLDFEVLLELIESMTLAAQESILNGVSLESFLQLLEQDHKTCTLRIISGYQTGYIYLNDGRLVGAQTGALRNKDAALTILSWPNCTINISEQCRYKPTMDLSIHSLVVEWCIYKDERASALSTLQTV